jgi:hypothetical protein
VIEVRFPMTVTKVYERAVPAAARRLARFRIL